MFYRAAINRMDDAVFLLSGRTTAAVYLAGYGVECMLKALILSVLPEAQRIVMLASFHGRRAHDFDWLRQQYAERWKGSMPAELARHFTRVNTWSTNIRYETRTMRKQDAELFVESAARSMEWAEGRM